VAPIQDEISLVHKEIKMRKIIAYLAVSADGYIARKDGGIDWLHRPRPRGNYGFPAFVRSIDTIVWGRKTWDQVLTMEHAPDFGSKIKSYVFTRRPAKSAPNVTFLKDPVAKFAKRLRTAPGKNIWMMGGAGIIASFLDAGEIDEFSIHVIPVLIGDGIPLAAPGRRNVSMKLLSTKRFPDGVVHLNYRVLGTSKHA
jgi:dihydrofolate reductase